MTGSQKRRFERLVVLPFLLLAVMVVYVAMPAKLTAQSAANGPGEILQLFGMDESTMRQFVDGRQLSSDELEPLFRLLYLFPRFERLDLVRWRNPIGDGVALANDPEPARGEIFNLRGWVTELELIELPAESARRFEYDEFYKLRVRLASGDRSIIVCCREVPDAWQLPAARGGELPMSCDAMFLKVGQGASGSEELVFATDHVAWHPYEADPQLGITPGRALLGQAGMDVSLFDNLEQAKPIGHADRDCFYQMLWAVGRLDPAAMRQVASDRFDIAALLKRPQQEAGRFYQLRGVARRAIRVQVDDPDIREKYGISHYYEVDVFLSLPRTLKLVDPRDGESRQYQTYPVTFCVRDLPDGMPQGSEIRQEIAVCGSYMKLWSYKSRFVTGTQAAKGDPKRRQVSPLFIANTVRPIRAAYQRNAWPEVALVVGFLVSIVVIAVSGWYYARSDREFGNWRHRRPDQLPDGFDAKLD